MGTFVMALDWDRPWQVRAETRTTLSAGISAQHRSGVYMRICLRYMAILDSLSLVIWVD